MATQISVLITVSPRHGSLGVVTLWCYQNYCLPLELNTPHQTSAQSPLNVLHSRLPAPPQAPALPLCFPRICSGGCMETSHAGVFFCVWLNALSPGFSTLLCAVAGVKRPFPLLRMNSTDVSNLPGHGPHTSQHGAQHIHRQHDVAMTLGPPIPVFSFHSCCGGKIPRHKQSQNEK